MKQSLASCRTAVLMGTLMALALLAVRGNALADEDWNFYRGPRYDGHAVNSKLAEAWPADGPPVLWVREAGRGYSSLVAWNGRIATQWQTLAGQCVVCLDADTGETVWQYRYDWPYLPSSVYPGPRSTPTYWNGRLFFAAPNGLVGCLDAASGKLLWSDNLKQQFDGKGTDFGYSCSPVVVDGKVVIPGLGSVDDQRGVRRLLLVVGGHFGVEGRVSSVSGFLTREPRMVG